MIHHVFVDCIPQLSCVCLLNNRSSEDPLPPSTDSRASSVSADRGRTETVLTVELFPLEDLIYYGRGKSERMTDINIKVSVVLKTASAWQRQKSRLLVTRGARIASSLFERAAATPLPTILCIIYTFKRWQCSCRPHRCISDCPVDANRSRLSNICMNR